MAVLSRVNFTSQQRLDLTHVLASESYEANDFRAITSFFTGISNSYVVSGMKATGTAGLTITITVANSVLFNAMDSSGAFYFARPDDADIVLTLPASTVGIFVQARFLTMTQAQVNQIYWNPLSIIGNSVSGNEYAASVDSQVVTVLEISTNNSGFSLGYIPILRCSTQTSSVYNIEDCRPLLFRLGLGGANPQAYNTFPWSANRGEPVFVGDGTGDDANSSFRSTDMSGEILNDKGISTMKQWMDAVMTRIAEIAGTPIWYDSSPAEMYVPNLNLNTAYLDSDAGHSINCSEATTLIWSSSLGLYTLQSEGTKPVCWQANYGVLKWFLGNTFTSAGDRTYTDTKFVSPTINEGDNLYLALQREVGLGIGNSVTWAPSNSPYAGWSDPTYTVVGIDGDFAGLAVGDYIRKYSQGMSQYHKVVAITDGVSQDTTVGHVLVGGTGGTAVVGVQLAEAVTYSSEALRYFRSRYSSADLITDHLAIIADTDDMWLGRRTGQLFMLRRFGLLAPGQEITILGDHGTEYLGLNRGDPTLILGNSTSFLYSGTGTLSSSGVNIFQIVKRRNSNYNTPLVQTVVGSLSFSLDNSLGVLTFTLPISSPVTIPLESFLWVSLPDSAPITCSAGNFSFTSSYASQYTADLVQEMKVVLTSTASLIVSFIAAGVYLTSGNALVPISCTLGLSPGVAVSGTYIPNGTTVLSVNGTTSVTLSAAPTSSGTSTLTFSNCNGADIVYFLAGPAGGAYTGGNSFTLWNGRVPLATSGGLQLDATAAVALGSVGMVYANATLVVNGGTPAHDTLNGPIPRAQIYVLLQSLVSGYVSLTPTENYDFRDLYPLANFVTNVSNSFVTANVQALEFFDGTILTVDGQFITNNFAIHGSTSVFGGLKDSYVTTPVFLGDNNTYGGINNTQISTALMAPGKTVNPNNAAETILGGLNSLISSQVDETNTGFINWTTTTSPYYTISGGNFTVVNGGSGRIKGQLITWTAGQFVALSPITGAAPAAGLIVVSVIGGIGTVQLLTSFSDTTYQTYIPLFEVFVDSSGTNFIVAKETHPYNFNTNASRYLHNNVGTVIQGTGASISVVTPYVSGPTVSANSEIAIVSGDTLVDHGLSTTISPVSPIITWKFMYTDSSGHWTQASPGVLNTIFPPEYNNSGVLTLLNSSGAGTVGVFTVYVAKDDLTVGGGPTYIAVFDTNHYNDTTSAQTAIENGLTAHATIPLAYVEAAQLGYVIVQNSVNGGYIADVIVDKSTFNSKLVGGGNQGEAGLVTTTTNNFDAMLSGLDTTVQHALDTIDDFAKDGFLTSSFASPGFHLQNSNDSTKILHISLGDLSTGISVAARVPMPGTGVSGDVLVGTTVKVVPTGSYLVLQSDRVLEVGSTGSPATTDLMLPTTPYNGTTITIKDAAINASAYPTTIHAPAGVTIDGVLGAYTLSDDGFSVNLQYSSVSANWSIVFSVGVVHLSRQLSATASPSWNSIDLPFQDISTSSTTTNAVSSDDLPTIKGSSLVLLPADYVHGVVFKRTTAFAGDSITNLNMTVGNAGTANKYLTSFDLYGVTGGKSNSGTAAMESVLNANQLYAYFTSVGGVLNGLTSGTVQLNILKSNLIGTPGARNQPTWKKYVVNYTNLTTAGLTQTITLPTSFSGACVTGAVIRLDKDFSGGTIGSMTASVTVGATTLIPATTVFGSGNVGSFITNDSFLVVGPSTALVVNVNFTSTVGNLNVATQGELEIYLQVSQFEVPPSNFSDNTSTSKQVSSTPTWSKYSASYTSFASGTTSKTVQVAPIFGDEIVHAIILKPRVAFTGTTTATAAIGNGVLTPAGVTVIPVSTGAYISPVSVTTAVSETNFSTYNTMIFDLFDSTSRSLQLTVATTGGNTSALTAGLIDVYVLKSKLASK